MSSAHTPSYRVEWVDNTGQAYTSGKAFFHINLSVGSSSLTSPDFYIYTCKTEQEVNPESVDFKITGGTLAAGSALEFWWPFNPLDEDNEEGLFRPTGPNPDEGYSIANNIHYLEFNFGGQRSSRVDVTQGWAEGGPWDVS